MKAIERFLARVSSVQLADVFNPYSDRCSHYDRKDAVKIRKENLRSYLHASILSGTDVIWFGRDLGYRGGRRTGVALTDDMHLPQLASWCKSSTIRQATVGDPVGERTAAVIWGMIREIGDLPFMWNIFPFHPHEPESSMTNRAHTRKEMTAIWDMNKELLDILQPSTVVAIGNDAANAFEREGLAYEQVRHPSYGGQAEFVAGLRRLYGLAEVAGIGSKRLPGSSPQFPFVFAE